MTLHKGGSVLIPKVGSRPHSWLPSWCGWLGVLLVLAPTLSLAQVRAAGPLGNESCASVIGGKKSNSAKFKENSRVHLVLWSTKDFIQNDLGFGKWVGVVDREAGDDPNAASSLFPGLQPGKSGCLLFLAYTDPASGSDESAAFLLLHPGMRPAKLPNSLICYHTFQNPPSAPPHGSAAADHCIEGDTVTTTVTARDGAPVTVKWAVTAEGLGAGFKNATITLLSTEEIDGIAQALDKPGPWFPCALTGCCRTY